MRTSMKGSIYVVTLTLFAGIIGSVEASANDVCQVKFEHFPYKYPNEGQNCSGRGLCNPRDRSCLCDEGFTGLSDWINTEGFDCQINETVISVFWVLNLFVNLAYMWFSFPKIYERQQAFLKKKRDTYLRKRVVISVFRERGLVACLFYVYWVFPAMVLTALVKLALADERVGVTFVMTFLFSFVKIGWWLGLAYMYQPYMLKQMLSHRGVRNMHSERVHNLLKISDRFASANLLVSTILSLLPFVTLIRGSAFGIRAENVYVAYISGQIVSFLAYMGQAYYLKKKVVRVFTIHFGLSPMTTITNVMKKICDLQNQVLRQAGLQLVIYTGLLFFPYLWNKHDYMLPIAWMSIPVLARNLAQTYVPNLQSTLSKPTSGDRDTRDNNDETSDDTPGNYYEVFPNLFKLTSGKFRSVYTSKGHHREQVQPISTRTKDRIADYRGPQLPSF